LKTIFLSGHAHKAQLTHTQMRTEVKLIY